jgi:predicted nucleic acid-binding protein
VEKKKVYLETSVISYLTARPSRDVIKLAKQELTREWWDKNRAAYDLYVSTPVRDEAGKGDRDAARRRMEIMDGLTVLQTTAEALALANRIAVANVLPAKATLDILHISISAVHGIDYLATWNCKHISNAVLKEKILEEIVKSGYTPVDMTTPEHLWRQ